MGPLQPSISLSVYLSLSLEQHARFLLTSLLAFSNTTHTQTQTHTNAHNQTKLNSLSHCLAELSPFYQFLDSFYFSFFLLNKCALYSLFSHHFLFQTKFFTQEKKIAQPTTFSLLVNFSVFKTCLDLLLSAFFDF